MAVEYDGGVVVGADSRTTTGYVGGNCVLSNGNLNITNGNIQWIKIDILQKTPVVTKSKKK